MIPEVYVDKEIMPLLLKAKCPLRKVIKQDFRPVYYTKDSNDEGWQDCDAYYIPTQAQVKKWLREVHSLWCEISWEGKGLWCMEVFSLMDEEFIPDSIVHEIKSYEEACEAAIKYCLENLI